MIFLATLAATALSPMIQNDKVVAFRVMTVVGDKSAPVVVPTRFAKVLADAVANGGGQKLIIRTERNLNVVIGSKDDSLSASMDVATKTERAADRLANPLAYAVLDLEWAEQMLRCARADVMLRDDVPTDWVSNHEAHVAKLRTLVETLSAAV
jgi:hypothetical protein